MLVWTEGQCVPLCEVMLLAAKKGESNIWLDILCCCETNEEGNDEHPRTRP